MQGLNVAGGQLTRTAANAATLGGALGAITSKASLLFRVAAPLAAIAAALALTIGPAKEFETAWVGVTKTVEGTPAQLDAVRKGILDMSREIPAAATEIAAVAEVAGQLGISTVDLLDFTRVMIDLGETTNLSATEAATALARFGNIMATSTNSNDPLYWERLGSTIVDLGNNLATTEQEIGMFANRIAGAGAVVQMTEADILAIGGALSSVGIFAEAGGTAVSRVFLEIDEAVSTLATGGSAKLEVFAKVAGITAGQFAALQESNPAEAFTLFIEGLRRIEEEGGSAVGALEQLGLSNVRVRDAVLRLAAAGTLLRDAIKLGNDAWSENSALAEEAGRRYESTQARIDRLRNVFDVLAISIGTPLLTGLVTVVDHIADFVISLDQLAPAVSMLSDGLVDLVSSLGPIGGLFADLVGTGVEITFAALAGLAVAVGGAMGLLADVISGVTDALASLPVAAVIGTLVTLGIVAYTTGAAIVTLGLTGSAALSGLTTSALGAATSLIAVAGPAAVLVGALALIGSSYLEASKAADEFRDRVEAASVNENGVTTLQGLTSSLALARAEYDRTSKATEGFVTGLKGMAGVLPFVSNDLLNQRSVMFEAGDAIEDYEMKLDRVRLTMETIGDQFGLTAAEVQALAIAAGIDPGGLLEEATWNATSDAIYEAVAAFEDVDAAIVESVKAMSDGQATLGDFEKIFGLTAESIEFLANSLEDVSFSDLFSDDPEVVAKAAAAVQDLKFAYQEMGEAAGFSAEQMIQGEIAMADVTTAAEALQGTVSKVRSAFEATAQQADNLQGATDAFLEVGAAFSQGDADARTFLEAMRELSLEYAASGASAEQAIQYQRDLLGAWLDSAEAAGISEKAAYELAVQYGLIPETVLTEVAFRGQEAQEATERYQLALEQIAAKEYVARLAADGSMSEEEYLRVTGLFKLFEEGDYTALLEADGTEAITEALAVEVALRAFMDGDYTAALNVRDDGVRASVAEALLAIGAIDEQTFQAILDGNADPLISETDAALRALERVEDDIDVNMDFEWSEAERELNRMRALMDGIQSKSVTVTVNGKTFSTGSNSYTPSTKTSSGGVTYQADGGVMEFYSDGGMRRENHVAQIARGRTPYRVWAEPETGGEAYIPMGGHKRARSTAILSTVARSFGYGLKRFADGGIDGADVQRFNAGGISMQRFESANGLPGVVVDVRVDATSLGQVNVDLAPVLRTIDAVSVATDRVSRSFRDAASVSVSSAGQMADAFQRAGVDIEPIGQEILRSMDMSMFVDTLVNDFGWARDQLKVEIESLGGTVDAAMDAMIGSGIDLSHIWEGVFRDAANATELFERALTDVDRAVGRVDSAIRSADDSFDVLRGAVRGARDAHLDYLDAIDQVKEAIGDGQQFGTVSEEARRNYRDLIDAGDAMRQYAIETAGAGQSAGEALTNWRTMQAEFRQLALAAGLPMVEINRLVDELFAIPESVIVQIAAEGELAQREIDKIDSAVDYLDSKTVLIEISAEARAFETIAQGVAGALSALDAAEAEASIDADSSSFDDAMAGVQAELILLDSAIAIAELSATDDELVRAYLSARAKLDEIDQIIADPEFSADSESFSVIAGQVQSILESIDRIIAIPEVSADAAIFNDVIRGVEGDARRVGGTVMVPEISADARYFNDVVRGTLGDMRGLDEKVASPTVRVNDLASGPLGSISTKIDSLNRTVVTRHDVVTTHTGTKIPIPPIVWQELGYKSEQEFRNRTGFAAGGFVDRADAHRAEIASGSGPIRMWAEPETQGESYIPHANDWRRPGALQVLERTASLMGRRVVENAGGGFYGSSPMDGRGSAVVLNAPVSVQVSAQPGMDEAMLARHVGEQVRRAFSAQARDIGNLRRN